MQRIIFVAFLLTAVIANAQFKADNVRYKTVFPQELCKTLMENKGYLILDVRSQGEYDDTSSSSGLNIGHLKNAVNINITQLGQRVNEIASYRDQPVFVYCSHSQRSRRASRLLADSGFTKIYNINGGLTDFYKQGIESNPCGAFQIETSVPYKIVAAREILDAKKRSAFYIIDLRSDSVFKGISNERSRLQGKFTNATNIPFEKFKSLTSYDFPTKPILVVDEFGNESPQAAKMLVEKGIKDVTVLFDGMSSWIDFVTDSEIGKKSLSGWSREKKGYDLISGRQFAAMVKLGGSPIVIDVRTKDEFSNASKNYWQNIGQVKDAINIPSAEIKTSTLLPQSRTASIVVYGFNNQPEIFEAAKALTDLGYKNVNVLQGGIWGLRWASHNIKGRESLNDLVVNIPEQNL